MSRPGRAQALLLLMLGAVLAGCWGSSGHPKPMQMTLRLEPDGTVPPETALAQARDVVRKRLDEFGFGDAVVEVAPGQRISVRLSGVEDPERVRKLILTPALLELRLVRFPTEREATSQEAVLGHYNGQLPPDLEILSKEVRDENGKVAGTRYYAIEKQPVITGRDFATVQPSRGHFGPVVEFQLKPEASEVFADATGSNIGKLLAIVLDQRVVSAIKIYARISDSGVIEGAAFTEEQAHDLVVALRSGALPGRLTMVEERAGRRY